MRLNTNVKVKLLVTLTFCLSGCIMKPSGGKKNNKQKSAEATQQLEPATAVDQDTIGMPPATTPTPGNTQPTMVPPAELVGLSSRADLRFKPQDIMAEDIADVLDLPTNEICIESGGKSCQEVHLIALAGVNPYDGGATDPITESMVTTPIAWERIILSACAQRVDLDLDAPASGKIFTNLSIDSNGKLRDLNSVEVSTSIDTLYRRAIKRPASAAEIKAIKGFYEDVSKSTQNNAAKEWARLSCYAVLSSLEFVFY